VLCCTFMFTVARFASRSCSAFVALMTFLRASYDAAKSAENNHEDAPDDEDGEYLSIMLS
jgi:hypothetical protein